MENLKLSDYMLQGTRLTERMQHDYIQPLRGGGGKVRACALGAACYVKDHDRAVDLGNRYGSREAYETFPELGEVIDEAIIPDVTELQGYRFGDLHDLITGLNDFAGWSRDRIARYLKKLGY
jgi:hypothetical protein